MINIECLCKHPDRYQCYCFDIDNLLSFAKVRVNLKVSVIKWI